MSRTHVVIPDTQAKPGVPVDHLGWIGSYVVDQFRDRDIEVVHLGDHADMPSLSMYDKGKRAMEGRRYSDDITAANDAFAVLCEPLETLNRTRATSKHAQWWPSRHVLLGNHEDRINRATELDAILHGTMSTDDLCYADRGWQVHPFLEPVFLDGVGYAHYWYNPMNGRPIGGMIETRLKTIGHSFTQGHQQTLMYGLRFVAGRSQHGLVAGACYLHDEDYKGPQGNAHWRGIVICHEVRNGSYDPMFVSLDYLCRRYEGVSLERFTAKRY